MDLNQRLIAGSQQRVVISDDSCIGECRRIARRLAQTFEFDEVATGQICIVATELATNILRHADHGEMLLQVLDDGMIASLELLAIDQGPGMEDLESCMQDGYSSGGTAGQGLGAIRRLSTIFDAFSLPSQGTVILSRTDRRARGTLLPPSSGLEMGAVNVSVAGEIECGDTWRVACTGSLATCLVVDGLGHGPLAAAASRVVAEAFGRDPFALPGTAMPMFHRAAAGTRGAAAALAHVNFAQSKVLYAGVGNVSGTLITREASRGMVSHNGTLGLQLPRTHQFEYEWPAGGFVIMHSDGLSARWSVASYPGLYSRHAGVIAAVLYRDFVRRRDDATVIVACQRN